MLNQLTVDSVSISDLTVLSDSISIILAGDRTGSDALRIKYQDTDSDGQATAIADQADANTHNGVVSFDLGNYKVADTVTVTVTDMDLNTDSDLIDVYTVQNSGSSGTGNDDTVGDSAGTIVMEVGIAGERWTDNCDATFGLA